MKNGIASVGNLRAEFKDLLNRGPFLQIEKIKRREALGEEWKLTVQCRPGSSNEKSKMTSRLAVVTE